MPKPPAAVIFSVYDELIARHTALRQHVLIDALHWNAELGVVQFLLQDHEKVRGVRIEGEKVQKLGLPRHQARQGPVGTYPYTQRLIGIETRECVEQVRLIVEEAMFQMHREGQGVQHQPARRGEVMDHLERVILIEKMFGRPVVGGQTVFASTIRRHGVEVDVERERAEIPVDIDAIVLEAQAFVQVAGRGDAGTRLVDVQIEFLDGGNRAAEGLEKTAHQSLVRAPDPLRPEFDHTIDAVEGPTEFELTIERKNGGTKAHMRFFCCFGAGNLETKRWNCNCIFPLQDRERSPLRLWPRPGRWRLAAKLLDNAPLAP